MRMPPANEPENKCSTLLSPEQNTQVFRLLGLRCPTISTTVVQLFTTYPPHHAQWHQKATGVLCFVKDNSRKNYFFRLFCLNRNAMLWEHELYNNMEYVEATSQLHMFEGEDGIIAFNYASSDEAREMKNVVEQKIQMRRRKDEKRARHIAQSQSLKLPNENNSYKKSPNPEAKLAKRKRNITKADISTPMDFKHISHVGWDPNSGFDVNSQDEQLKKFLKEAGVSEKQLQDKDTREFIYDFINKHGGREAVSEVVPPPAVPPRGPPRPSHARAAPPPPPNSRQETSFVKKSAPPPIPPAMQSHIVSAAPNVPPPPPPPPMSSSIVDSGEIRGGPAPPPPPPMVDNSALMDSIRNGTSLKPVEDRKVPAADDARSDLLSEIRKGCTLKPVTAREIKPASSPSPNSSASNGTDLASALARALAERKKVIHSEDDDDDESGTSNDEDWD